MTDTQYQFLTRTFGIEKGEELGDEMEKQILLCMKNHEQENKIRQKVIRVSILPSITLYDIFQKQGNSKEEAYSYIQCFLHEYGAKASQSTYQKMVKMPFFFPTFRTMFSIGLNQGFYDVTIDEKNKHKFEFTIQKCLWHDICNEYGCPELCQLFCDADDITFSGFSEKLLFYRTQALGKKGSCCDFHFIPVKKDTKHNQS